MIESIVGVLESLVDEIIVVSHESLRLPALVARVPLRVVVDRVPGLGPLAGIREGLAAATAERAFVTSADAPFLEPAFVQALFDRPGAVAPKVDGFVQPIAAVYPTALAALAAELLAAERRRPLWLLEAAGYSSLGAAELPGLRSLTNLNTPADYLAALATDAVERAHPLSPACVVMRGQARARAGADEVAAEVGTLAQIGTRLDLRFPELRLIVGGAVSPDYRLWFAACGFAHDLHMPIGPGERVEVRDAPPPALGDSSGREAATGPRVGRE